MIFTQRILRKYNGPANADLIFKQRGTDMNINTIKRLAFLALALAVPSVASAMSFCVSVEEAKEIFGIDISIEETPHRYMMTIRYPDRFERMSDQAVLDDGPFTLNRAESLLISFQLNSSDELFDSIDEVRLLVDMPGPIYVPAQPPGAQAGVGEVTVHRHDEQNHCHQWTMRYVKEKQVDWSDLVRYGLCTVQ